MESWMDSASPTPSPQVLRSLSLFSAVFWIEQSRPIPRVLERFGCLRKQRRNHGGPKSLSRSEKCTERFQNFLGQKRCDHKAGHPGAQVDSPPSWRPREPAHRLDEQAEDGSSKPQCVEHPRALAAIHLHHGCADTPANRRKPPARRESQYRPSAFGGQRR